MNTRTGIRGLPDLFLQIETSLQKNSLPAISNSIDMIVSYYPGSGGNRYLRMLQGLEWQTTNQGYDGLVQDQLDAHRYLYPDSVIRSDSAAILTHCMNTPLIKKICPDRSITVILGDMQKCLRREWSLYGHERYHRKIIPTVDDLELYAAVKDPSWPQVSSADEWNRLSAEVKQEFDQFQNLRNKPLTDLTPLACLQKEFAERIESAYEILQWHIDYYQRFPLDMSMVDTVIDIDGHSSFAAVMKFELASYSSEIFDRCWQQLA